ncbi:Aspyridones cluster regulator apdR [Colletotrichum fructicola Nara gc5]|uniref:Aspyridones cluster regulator apdR n=1 Tax=Colletotrichum fructicola (strain Nara gc5) TaxID=1213859 RepID=A0A7J6IM96_COLFN|nr:Aspyridones cluster regulator apdR [Colletotrichum fructicola Nara gc5]
MDPMQAYNGPPSRQMSIQTSFPASTAPHQPAYHLPYQQPTAAQTCVAEERQSLAAGQPARPEQWNRFTPPTMFQRAGIKQEGYEVQMREARGGNQDRFLPDPPLWTPGTSSAPSLPIQHVNFVRTKPKKCRRVAMACDSCRQLKSRCDGQTPCKLCDEKNQECVYRAVEHKMSAIESAEASLSKSLQSVDASLKEVLSREGLFKEVLSKEGLFKEVLSKEGLFKEVLSKHADDHGRSRQVILTDAHQDTAMTIDDSPLSWPSVQILTTQLLCDIGISDVKGYLLDCEESRNMLQLFRCGEDCVSALGAHHCPGLECGGLPDLRKDTVIGLVKSFQDNILNMYPIAMPGELDRKVEHFLNHVGCIHGELSDAANDIPWNRKRPRSGPSVNQSRQSVLSNCRRPNRTIDSAMILIVLALGELCQHQAGIADPAITSRERGTIPGVKYMALASDILGQQRGGWTLQHARMSIFDALYYGQLGRLIECQFHLLDADRALQVVMRCDLDRLRRTDPPIQNPKDNSILLVFWTCLHLLCDFIDLLDLPLSEQFPEWVSNHFLGQMHLRRSLDDVLHFPTPTEMRLSDGQTFVKSTLDGMTWIAQDLQFDEQDSPSRDFMEARLRSKFWDVQAAIFKPFIKTALNQQEESF